MQRGVGMITRTLNVLINPFFGCLIAYILHHQSDQTKCFLVLTIESLSIVLHFVSVRMNRGLCSRRSKAFHSNHPDPLLDHGDHGADLFAQGWHVLLGQDWALSVSRVRGLPWYKDASCWRNVRKLQAGRGGRLLRRVWGAGGQQLRQFWGLEKYWQLCQAHDRKCLTIARMKPTSAFLSFENKYAEIICSSWYPKRRRLGGRQDHELLLVLANQY